MTEDASAAAATVDEIEVESTELVDSAAVDGERGNELGGIAGGEQRGRSRGNAHDDLVAEGDAAGDYLERLLDILDYDGDIDLDVEGERAVVSIVGDGDIDKLVGENGEVLSALQELTRLAAGMETGTRSRLMLDVGGFRARRREELSVLGREAAEKVVESGVAARLGAMNPFERKVVHDAVATVDGATSSSEGEEPRRRVVVSPAE
ncbi:MAG: R3H domain-containing nucleic acid-binding protein [Nakamurella sp.]